VFSRASAVRNVDDRTREARIIKETKPLGRTRIAYRERETAPYLFASCPRAWGQPSTSRRSTTTPEPARETAKGLAAEGQTIKHEQAKAAVDAAKEAKTEGKPPAEQKDAAKRPARLGQLERAKKLYAIKTA
jgi:hypothetical protein